MIMALEVKNKIGFLDCTVVRPEDGDPKLYLWKRCNTMVRSWILKAVKPTIAESIMYFDKAQDVWEDLRDRFSQSDPHRISELQKMIYNNKQGNLSISDYYSKCKGLWEQLADLRPLPLCECVPRCSCSLVSKVRQEREEDRVIRFLEGLNDEFDSVKSSVLLIEPLPTVDKVFKMAIKVERKLAREIGNSGIIQSNTVETTLAESEQNIAAVVPGSNYSNNGKKV